MDPREQQLIAALEDAPRDESAKLNYEAFLAENRPDSVEHQLLQRERELANAWKDQATLDRMVEEYIRFRTEQSDWFWDRRGGLNHLFRKFNVWLRSFPAQRRFAVSQALRYTLKLESDLDVLPLVIVRSVGPDQAYHLRDKVLDFVRRYKGATGCEPPLEANEIVLVIAPSWIDAI